MPNSWEAFLRPIDIPDRQTLLARAHQLQDMLLSHSNIVDEMASMRRLLEGSSHSSRGRPHSSRREAHTLEQVNELNSQDYPTQEEDIDSYYHEEEGYDPESYSNETSNTSRPNFSTPSRRGGRGGFRGNRRGGRGGFQRNKGWQYKEPPNGHPFPRDDTKKSSNKPSYPCKACGSPFHYDPDCPHYEAYKAKRNAHAIETGVERPEEAQLYIEAEYRVNQEATIENYAVFDIEYDHLPDNIYDPQVNTIRSLLDPSLLCSRDVDSKHIKDEWKEIKFEPSASVYQTETREVNESSSNE